jgi:flagellar biosynthetic protein FliQ
MKSRQRDTSGNVFREPFISRGLSDISLVAARKEGCERMGIPEATDLVRHTLIVAMLVSAPMLLIGLIVGVIVSLFQAVTQIQEQTLTFVPKIAAMIAAALLLLPWIGQQLLDYAATLFSGGML